MSATFPKVPAGIFSIAGGVIGCAFAVMGIINSFIPFLVALGLIIPPIAAIYVIDGFYTFRKAGYAATPQDAPPFRWVAIGVWLGSLAITVPATKFGYTLTTVPMLDAAILAAGGYFLLLRLIKPSS